MGWIADLADSIHDLFERVSIGQIRSACGGHDSSKDVTRTVPLTTKALTYIFPYVQFFDFLPHHIMNVSWTKQLVLALVGL